MPEYDINERKFYSITILKIFINPRNFDFNNEKKYEMKSEDEI